MMDLDAANNVFVVGNTINSFVTRKYASDGTLLWQRSDPAPEERTRASWISTDPAGNAIVTAYRVTGSSTPAGWIVITYDPQGNVVWRDVIPVALGETVRVETDGVGNAYVTGKMFLGTGTDAVTIKYAPDGAKRWTRTFNGGTAAVDVPSSIAVSPDGSRIATVGRSSTVFFAVIYDDKGREVRRSVRTRLGTAFDAAFGPRRVLYIGTSRYTAESSDRMTIVKFDARGETVWTRSYGDGNYVYRIAVDRAGDVIAVGAVDVYLDWVTLKVGPGGARRWARIYSATEGDDEVPSFLATDAANAIYVTGRAGPIPPDVGISLLMMTTVRYEPDGALAWVANDDINRGVSVRVGTDRAVYVLGQGEMLTVRYLQRGT